MKRAVKIAGWLGKIGCEARANEVLPASCPASFASSSGDILMKKLLVANRGEIACRVMTTAKKFGIPTVAVYSDADRNSNHTAMACESFNIGPPQVSESYLRQDKILDVALSSGATAIHPGYGFLSEDAGFAKSCEEAGVTFIGPPQDAIRSMGDKSQAKTIMRAAGVPVVPGYEGDDQELDRLLSEGVKIGYPILVKAVMGGGGKGMKLVMSEKHLKEAILSAKREAKSSFGDDRVLLERFIEQPRHIEVQIFADSHGDAIHLLERDCSVQRRHQKVLEESPGPSVTSSFREELGKAAVDAAKAVGYVSAGTVEFIVDAATQEFFFMEMNTRLQVEHPVSEWVCGIDLVEWQLRIATGEPLPCAQQDIKPRGHAIEARVYSEVPQQHFLPGTGVVQRWKLPSDCVQFCLPESIAGVRVDSGVKEGDEIGVNYDPMIAKVIAGGETRQLALQNLYKSLQELQVCGLPTNLAFLRRVLLNKDFIEGDFTTNFIELNKDELLGPTTYQPEVLALVAAARIHLSRSEYENHHLGPWGLMDWKHLNQLNAQTVRVTDSSGTIHSMSVQPLGKDNFVVQTGQDTSAIDVRGFSIEKDVISAQASGQLIIGRISTFGHSAHNGIAMWVLGQAFEFKWDLPRWDMLGSSSTQNDAQIVAPMPGTVVKVNVKLEDTVEAGDVLVVLEAMKMEYDVKALKSGKIMGVNVGVGSKVEDGSVLVLVN